MSIITNINISPISISANLVGAQYDNFEITSITMKDGKLYHTTYTDSSEEPLFSGGSGSSSLFKSYTSVVFIKIVQYQLSPLLIVYDRGISSILTLIIYLLIYSVPMYVPMCCA